MTEKFWKLLAQIQAAVAEARKPENVFNAPAGLVQCRAPNPKAPSIGCRRVIDHEGDHYCKSGKAAAARWPKEAI